VSEQQSADPLRIGVSSCLLGSAVRYDGGHKRDRELLALLGPSVEWIAVCPEVEAGMGIPRPALQLVRDGEELRLREVASGRDHTREMQRFAARRLRELRKAQLDGYVLKKSSPSCGMAGVRLHAMAKRPEATASGLFAHALMEAFPALPVEEEDRLRDPQRCEHFLERALAYRRQERASRLVGPTTGSRASTPSTGSS